MNLEDVLQLHEQAIRRQEIEGFIDFLERISNRPYVAMAEAIEAELAALRHKIATKPRLTMLPGMKKPCGVSLEIDGEEHIVGLVKKGAE